MSKTTFVVQHAEYTEDTERLARYASFDDWDVEADKKLVWYPVDESLATEAEASQKADKVRKTYRHVRVKKVVSEVVYL
jgi:hypothetical protein